MHALYFDICLVINNYCNIFYYKKRKYELNLLGLYCFIFILNFIFSYYNLLYSVLIFFVNFNILDWI
jgi:hypothetical protein